MFIGLLQLKFNSLKLKKSDRIYSSLYLKQLSNEQVFFITFFRGLNFYRDSVQTKDFLNTFFPFLNQWHPI